MSTVTHHAIVPANRPKHCPRTHAVVSRQHTRGLLTCPTSSSKPTVSTPSTLTAQNHRVHAKSASSVSFPRFSTSAVPRKKHGPKRDIASSHSVTKGAPSAIEGDIIYRKEGDKIIPIAPNAADQVEAPVSGLFSQFEDFSKPSSAPVPVTSLSTNKQQEDLSTLTLKDMFPSDDFIKQLLRQEKLDITLEETKDLVQTLVDVLPLPEGDSKRVQVEKEFWNVCKKKNVPIYGLATWSLQYTKDGPPLALALLKIATANGDILSRYSYGVLLYRGAKHIPADPVKGRAILESLAKPRNNRSRGLPLAMSTLAGIYARDDKNFEAARDMYLAAANQGVVEARVALGRMYLNGELPQDVAMARKCFQMVVKADDGCAEAHFLLGALEMQQIGAEGAGTAGEATQPNYKAAFQHYQKAASKGLAEAQYNVGRAYLTGMGVPKNDALAVEYWKMAGQQGFGLAQLSLGAYYFQDESPQEESESQGSDSEGVAATKKARTVVKHEWDSSKKDLMQAQKWFTLASRRPGQLGLEGKRLRAQVDEAIRKGGASKNGGRMCAIM
ncbi:hypothetical protein BG011_003795 [Mortierella polycephala]|uniref:HCP-like protein n=1 Tax=Mortierella polycephala TaxID=41804 RepID=A0A9P6U393_9FUNG|nr:hypothetical protein BG011_003795 [Mortierella polycephala]